MPRRADLPPPSSGHLRLEPLKHSALRGRRPEAIVHVPVAAVRMRPLQHGEVPAPRRRIARVLGPVAAVRPRPLKHSEVPAPRRLTARARALGAAVRPRPLQYFKVPAGAPAAA